jgi:hypothetical protein
MADIVETSIRIRSCFGAGPAISVPLRRPLARKMERSQIKIGNAAYRSGPPACASRSRRAISNSAAKSGLKFRYQLHIVTRIGRPTDRRNCPDAAVTRSKSCWHRQSDAPIGGAALMASATVPPLRHSRPSVISISQYSLRSNDPVAAAVTGPERADKAPCYHLNPDSPS